MLSGIVFLATSLGTALVFLALNNWSGAGDMPAFIFWSLPPSAAVFLMFRKLKPHLRDTAAFWRYALLSILGGTLGFGWTVIAALLLGGWIAAFSVPVLLCWIAGGAFAGIAAAWHSDSRSWPVALLSSVLIVAMLFAEGKSMLEPAPHMRVVLRPETTHADIDRFWNEVVGDPGRTPTEHSMIEGVSGVGIVDYEDGRPVFDVRIRKGVSRERRDSIVARIRGASFVARLDTLP